MLRFFAPNSTKERPRSIGEENMGVYRQMTISRIFVFKVVSLTCWKSYAIRFQTKIPISQNSDWTQRGNLGIETSTVRSSGYSKVLSRKPWRKHWIKSNHSWVWMVKAVAVHTDHIAAVRGLLLWRAELQYDRQLFFSARLRLNLPRSHKVSS